MAEDDEIVLRKAFSTIEDSDNVNNDDKMMLIDGGDNALKLYSVGALVNNLKDTTALAIQSRKASERLMSPPHSDMCRTGRNIMEVLDDTYGNVTTIERCFEILHELSNNDHVNDNDTTYWKDMPDYSLLEVGDYLELDSFKDDEGYEFTKDEFGTTRIDIAGFNFYKGMGNTGSGTSMVAAPTGEAECRKNHILWTFDQNVRLKRMHSANTVADHSVGMELWNYLQGSFYNGLKRAIVCPDAPWYIYAEYATTWVKENCWVPSVYNVYGSYRAWGSAGTYDTQTVNVTQMQYPIYSKGFQYYVKRNKGTRYASWTSSTHGGAGTPFSSDGMYIDSTDNCNYDMWAWGYSTQGVSPCFITV